MLRMLRVLRMADRQGSHKGDTFSDMDLWIQRSTALLLLAYRFRRAFTIDEVGIGLRRADTIVGVGIGLLRAPPSLRTVQNKDGLK